MIAEPSSATVPNLRRVARALGVPVGAFLAPSERGSALQGVHATAAEARALVVAFMALRDPAARARCVAAVESELLRGER